MTKKSLNYIDTVPRPKISDAWNEKLNNYIKARPIRNINAVRMVLDFLNFCQIKDGILLEIGCGSGWLRRYLRNIYYIGLEVLIRKDINIDFPMAVGIGEKLPFKDESVNHIVLYATLDHVADPLEVLRESFRVLKSEGDIYVLSSVDLPNGLRKVFVYGFLLFQKMIFLDCASITRNIRKTVLREKDKLHTFEFRMDDIKKLLLKANYSEISHRYFLNTCFLKGKKTKR